MSVPSGPAPGTVKLREASLTPLIFTTEDVAMVCVVWVPCPSTADGMSAYCDSFYYEAAKTQLPGARRSLLSRSWYRHPAPLPGGYVCTLIEFDTRVRGQEAAGEVW